MYCDLADRLAVHLKLPGDIDQQMQRRRTLFITRYFNGTPEHSFLTVLVRSRDLVLYIPRALAAPSLSLV
jgi:hypothetical protein